jgi:hypothetical protein
MQEECVLNKKAAASFMGSGGSVIFDFPISVSLLT